MIVSATTILISCWHSNFIYFSVSQFSLVTRLSIVDISQKDGSEQCFRLHLANSTVSYYNTYSIHVWSRIGSLMHDLALDIVKICLIGRNIRTCIPQPPLLNLLKIFTWYNDENKVQEILDNNAFEQLCKKPFCTSTKLAKMRHQRKFQQEISLQYRLILSLSYPIQSYTVLFYWLGRPVT